MSTQVYFTEENQMNAAAIAEADANGEAPPAALALTPAHFLQQALDSNLDPDRLEKFMELYERWQKGEAEKAYTIAMQACQSEMKPIERNAWNSQTQSHYLSNEHLHAQLKPVWLKHGFTLSGSSDTSPLPNHYRAVLEVRHVGGHSTRHFLDGPADDKGMKGTPNKTGIQGVVSTMSYLDRKLTCMVFNVTIAGEDRDGNGGAGQPLTDAQLDELDKLLIRVVEKHGEKARRGFYKFMQRERLGDLTQGDFLKAKGALNDKLAAEPSP
jgi:hypothetical protein